MGNNGKLFSIERNHRFISLILNGNDRFCIDYGELAMKVTLLIELWKMMKYIIVVLCYRRKVLGILSNLQCCKVDPKDMV